MKKQTVSTKKAMLKLLKKCHAFAMDNSNDRFHVYVNFSHHSMSVTLFDGNAAIYFDGVDSSIWLHNVSADYVGIQVEKQLALMSKYISKNS